MTDKICCNCQYYCGVKGTPGHAPCELKNSMTTWSKTCESICLIPLRLLIGTTDEPETNADRIRSMTDDELAELWWERVDCGECPVHKCPVHRYCRITGQDCKKLALDWLRQECE